MEDATQQALTELQQQGVQGHEVCHPCCSQQKLSLLVSSALSAAVRCTARARASSAVLACTPHCAAQLLCAYRAND